MKIYTKTGDDGDTGLFGGGRVPKDDVRVEAYGTVDELNASLGVVLTNDVSTLAPLLRAVQAQLFTVGAILATPIGSKAASAIPEVEEAWIAALEEAIDKLEATLPPLSTFILPGGSAGGAALQFARTICRRAERRVTRLVRENLVPKNVLVYLNRLSDALFVMARAATVRDGVAETPWLPKRRQ